MRTEQAWDEIDPLHEGGGGVVSKSQPSLLSVLILRRLHVYNALGYCLGVSFRINHVTRNSQGLVFGEPSPTRVFHQKLRCP